MPYTLSFEDGVAEQLDVHYGGPQWRDRLQTFITGTGVVDNRKKELPEREGFYRDHYGSLWREDRRPFHMEAPALPTASFDGYQWPRPEEFFADDEGVSEARQFCSEKKDQ